MVCLINETQRTCQTPRYCDGGPARCAMGPKWWLEVVLFGLKSQCLGGVELHVLGLQCHPRDCNFWLEWFVWINGTQRTCQTPTFGYRGHVRCAMSPKRLLERVFFSLKSLCRRGVQRHVLGLQCHPRDCNFWLEWFVWINGIQEPFPMPSFGDGGHVRCSMGPK